MYIPYTLCTSVMCLYVPYVRLAYNTTSRTMLVTGKLMCVLVAQCLMLETGVETQHRLSVDSRFGDSLTE